MASFSLGNAFEKWEENSDGTIIVEGCVSSPALDVDGEIVEPSALANAIPEYLNKGTCREMHGPIAAGRPLEMWQEGEKTHVRIKVVDKGSCQKIKEGVLKGFSIGGKWLKKEGNRIKSLLLKDISLVDIPNNPDSYFKVAKFDAIKKEIPEDPKPDKSMEELLTKFDALAKEFAAVTGRLDKIESGVTDRLNKMEAGQAGLVSKADLSVDVKKLAEDFGAVKAELDSTKAKVLEGNRNDLIAKMDHEGRVPLNPETGVGYTSEELQKMDLGILRVLAANAPHVPLHERAISKSDSRNTSSKTGIERTTEIWERQYANGKSLLR